MFPEAVKSSYYIHSEDDPDMNRILERSSTVSKEVRDFIILNDWSLEAFQESGKEGEVLNDILVKRLKKMQEQKQAALGVLKESQTQKRKAEDRKATKEGMLLHLLRQLPIKNIAVYSNFTEFTLFENKKMRAPI